MCSCVRMESTPWCWAPPPARPRGSQGEDRRSKAPLSSGHLPCAHAGPRDDLCRCSCVFSTMPPNVREN